MKANDIIRIRVYNGRNKSYDFRRILGADDFIFNKKSYGKGFWEKKIIRNNDDSIHNETINKYKNFCKSNKLKIEVLYSEYLRSNNYRKLYFEKNKGFFNNLYFCAYCGFIYKKDNITIDHIFPIDKVSTSKFYQKLINFFQIKDVNDYKNLTCACKSCNSKKGRKMGLWIIRGFLGKYNVLWCFFWTIAIIFAIYFIKKSFHIILKL